MRLLYIHTSLRLSGALKRLRGAEIKFASFWGFYISESKSLSAVSKIKKNSPIFYNKTSLQHTEVSHL